MENANITETDNKKGMSKGVLTIVLILVIILTVLAGIAIGYWIFNLVHPAA